MLNPAALLRSASSSRSSSSRFLQVSSGCTNDAYESSNNDIEESCTVSGSHKSTLERLYAWEKKLYEEIKVLRLLGRHQFSNTKSNLFTFPHRYVCWAVWGTCTNRV